MTTLEERVSRDAPSCDGPGPRGVLAVLGLAAGVAGHVRLPRFHASGMGWRTGPFGQVHAVHLPLKMREHRSHLVPGLGTVTLLPVRALDVGGVAGRRGFWR